MLGETRSSAKSPTSGVGLGMELEFLIGFVTGEVGESICIEGVV